MRWLHGAGAGAGAVAVAAALVLAACGGPAPEVPPDAATVGLLVTGDGAVGADSLLACALRVAPADETEGSEGSEGSERAGAVSACKNLVDAQPDLVLPLAPGRHLLQAVRVACPGMPGDCPEDPYAELYSGPTGGAVVWACEVPVVLAARQAVTVRVEVSADEDGGGGVRARCTAA